MEKLEDRFPQHAWLKIEHQPHEDLDLTVLAWLEQERLDVTTEDAIEMVRSGQVWTIEWVHNLRAAYNFSVAAATLERALEIWVRGIE